MADRDHYHHGNLAAALQAEATRLVRDLGVHGFSVRAAARGVGVDVAAVYRHYRDKTALLRAVAREGFRELAAIMEADREGLDSAQDRLRAAGRAYVRFAVAEPELFRLMFGPFGAGGAEPLFGEGRSVAFEVLLDSLEALPVAGGCGMPIDQAAVAAWSMVHGLATLLVDGPIPGEEADAHTEVVLDVLLAGLMIR